jgi:agmatine/peptidylarginine deiminase
MRTLIPLAMISLFVTVSILASEQEKVDPWAEFQGTFEQLPKWQTPGEKSKYPPQIDRITPPPTGEVFLDPEYGEQEGVILRYPFGFGIIFAQMVDALQEYGVVYVLVNDLASQSDCYNFLAMNGVSSTNVEFIIQTTDANWTRDYGPWFVWEEDSSLSILDQIYYPDRPNDDFIPEFLETYWGMGYYGPNINHEGGNLMTDGHGTMMMTTHVYEANPGMTLQQVNDLYRNYFGQDTTYVFERIQFDATGHIDLWSKIMNDTTILVAQMQPNDVNYQLVENHAARMAQLPTAYGGTFNIVRCPMPPLSWLWILPYYKSYINSVLFNGLALIPIYGLEYDSTAISAYQQALGPEWEVIGIDCRNIAWAGGAIHCTTIGVPRHDADYLVEVEFTFEPDTSVITIPAGGGSFEYFTQVENLENNPITFDFWVDITLPNGTNTGPIFYRERINLSALATIGREMQQLVPASAPAGTYSYHGYVGSYLPLVISEEASFNFTKTGVPDMANAGEIWTLQGWDEAISAVACNIPESFTLAQNYPNPFNAETKIVFTLREIAPVTLNVFNVQGQLISTLYEGISNPGEYSVVWNAGDAPSGVYFYTLKIGRETSTKKCVLMK